MVKRIFSICEVPTSDYRNNNVILTSDEITRKFSFEYFKCCQKKLIFVYNY